MSSTFPAFRSRIRENLLLGVITLAPLVLTYGVLISVVRYLDEMMYVVFPSLKAIPTEYFGFSIPGIGIVVTFLLLFFVGGLAKTVVGKFLNRWSDSLMNRLPVVRGLYGVTKQISAVFFSQSPTSAFKKVVYVPFPHAGAQSLGFVASQIDEKECLVFVPTAPNPTSGYVIKYSMTDLKDANISIDAALQLIISCGALGKSYELKEHEAEGR
jgi:uncharacterized membrane protein